MNLELTIEAPAVFKPLDQPSRYKGLHGGRGSGKSWAAATMLVLRCLKEPGIRLVCAREIQKTLAESAKRLIEDRIASLGVGHMFRIQHDRIITPGDGLISFWGLADKNAESIKSLEAVKVCWIEEAQMLTKRSLVCYARPSALKALRFGRRGIPLGSLTRLTCSYARRSPTTPSWLRLTGSITRSSLTC